MGPDSRAPDRPVLRLNGVSIVAGGRRLLRGVDLALAPRERVALSGPSGCGKTTLLRAITGLVNTAAGDIELDGDCPGDLRWPCYRRRTVLVEQQPVLLVGTVRENLARPFSYRTATSTFPALRAAELLTRLGLADTILEQEARSLSQGEQQRVCLVRALLLTPQVLLLDEPTSALDEDATRAVEDLVSSTTEHDSMAALIVTHNNAQIQRWCRRVLDLRPFMAESGTAAGAATQEGR